MSIATINTVDNPEGLTVMRTPSKIAPRAGDNAAHAPISVSGTSTLNGFQQEPTSALAGSVLNQPKVSSSIVPCDVAHKTDSGSTAVDGSGTTGEDQVNQNVRTASDTSEIMSTPEPSVGLPPTQRESVLSGGSLERLAVETRLDDDQEAGDRPEANRVTGDSSKRLFYQYDRANDDIYKRILKVLASQSVLGVAAVLDTKSAPNGYQNLAFIVISIGSPAFTYVFDCYHMAAADILDDLRRFLMNPKIMKVVHSIYPTVSLLYQRYQVEMQNVIDLQIMDKSLRKRGKGETASLEDLIRRYVDPDFVSTAVVPEEEPTPDEGWDLAPGATGETLAEAAAMYGAFLLDIFRSQQQICIESAVLRIGANARSEMKTIKKTTAKETLSVPA